MNLTFTEILFWLFSAIIFYTFLGYGIVLYLCVRFKSLFTKKHPIAESFQPEITLLIAAYNEADIIDEKMKNCLSLNYPALKILWVTDGSTDNSNSILKKYPDAEVCFSPLRKGKTAALNHGLSHVTTPFVVFTDANTMLNKDAIDHIASCFRDKKVGCVSGEKRIILSEKEGASAGGEGIYWKYESKLKEWDSKLYSATGAAGELFAIRTHLFEPMPEDTLLDDFILSMRIAMKGYKIAYCKEAYACESGSEDIENESKRKVRIAAGGLQSIWRLLPLLNFFRYGIFSFQYISHRVLRWSVTPIMLFLLYPLNFVLMAEASASPVYTLLFILQTLFYISALAGFYFQNKKMKIKIFFVPMYFVFMNWSVLRAIPYLIKNKGKGSWEKAKRGIAKSIIE